MKKWILQFLKKLEKALPPAPGAHHAITAALYGSDQDGWDERLALHLVFISESVTLFLEDADFSSGPDALVAAIVDCHAERSDSVLGGYQPIRRSGPVMPPPSKL
jgi:hypothetical protein